MQIPKASDQICNYHHYIKERANDILKIKDRTYDKVEDLLWEVQNIADDIYNSVNMALEAGQSMENRLKEYRDAIEGLGFRRDK